ncbi:hypothetical protein SCLARK_001403 [Spiroplasma clarkii]|uniref:hypothetical protein n=1 Tax=Spiroplasma clarkii TaxID=2139 RepID=UPI000B579D51|nr:hypothetical protein [Spiroplasma clarkii]ARU91928.1 hypothetical protein SCLARK_001403 [Spiroplasma clarkii]
MNLSVVKLADFKYKSYYSKTKNIDLDLGFVKYFPSDKGLTFTSLNKQILGVLEKLPIKFEVKKNQNYFIIAQTFKTYTIKFRAVTFVRRDLNEVARLEKFEQKKMKLKAEHNQLTNQLKKIKAVDAIDRAKIIKQLMLIEAEQLKINNYDKQYQVINDTINRNGIVQPDLALQVSEAFVRADKIANGTLIAIKKILNYIFKNQFKYTYNIDMLLLTWFYEYFTKSINGFLDKKFNKSAKELDINNFMKEKNLSKWFRDNINIYDLYYFIFTKIGQVNTFFFAEVGFDEFELFRDISRYSLNTNSTFNLPSSTFLDFQIFDLKNYDHLSIVQEKMGNEYGYSKFIYDQTRNAEYRYFASPFIATGISNYPMFSKWLEQIGSNLKMTLSAGVKEQLESFRTREAMTEINAIGHNWLASYWTKLKYLAPYFDRKYPLATQFDFKTMLLMMTTMVDKTNEKNWMLKNDN